MMQILKNIILMGIIFVFPIAGYNITNNQGENKMYNLNPEMEKMLFYGTLAPSSHNAQMWKVRITGPLEIEVFLDTNRLLPQVDPDNREAFISIGTFLENLGEAAFSLGYRANIDIQEHPMDERAAIIQFIKDDALPPDNSYLSNILSRHTIRTAYLTNELTISEINYFLSSDQYHVFYYSFSSDEGKYLSQNLIKANRQQMADDNKELELSEWFRFSQKDIDQKKDGMVLDIQGIGGWIAGIFFNKDTVMSKIFREQGVEMVKNAVGNCSGYLVVTAEGTSPKDWISAGMLSEKIWLMAASKKIAIQPMSQLLEEIPWKLEIMQKIGLNKPIAMLFRVGYIKVYGKGLTRRRDLKDFIINQ